MLLLLIAAGCTKEPQYIDTTRESDNLYIVQTDTLQPAYSIYRLDSFQTSGTGKSIIGQTIDPYFGKTTAKSFCRFLLAPEGYLTVGSNTESYDSIALIMHTDKSYYGDSTQPWSASVHQLTEDLNAVNTYYYNHQSLGIGDQELGSLSRVIRPGVDDSVVIKLSDSLGSAIFGFYKSKNEAVASTDAFQRYFKGLCISSGSGNRAIYGFNAADTGTLIRLYYHDDQGIHVNKHLDFKSQAGNYQFDNIINDPTGTVTAGITPGHDVSSADLGHQLFMCDLAGIGTKITLPSIQTVAALPDYVKLQSAQLRILPVPGSFAGYPLLPTMGIGVSSQTSTSIAPLPSASGNTAQTGDLIIDELNGTGTGYTYDLTAYSQSEILSTAYTTNILYLEGQYISNARQLSMQRIVAADNSNVKSPSKLILQILFFKK